MNAVAEPIQFDLPKRPRVKLQDSPPDQRKVAILPIRALTDQKLTDGAFRALALVCSYCNRAGITWVSQKKLAEDAKVSRQAITNQLAQLRQLGYVEIIRKGFRGERCNTVRVIFDTNISAEDAIAMTSNKEDTRPPVIREEQERQAQEIDREGQARIARLISQALKQPLKQEKTMPTSGQTRTVKKMKEDIQKAKSKRSSGTTKPVDINVDNHASIGHPTVSNEEAHIGHSGVSPNTEDIYKDKPNKVKPKKELNKDLNKEDNLRLVLGHDGLHQLIDAGLTEQEIADGLDTLLPIYQAEGLTPKEQHLVDGLMQMHRDAT